MLVKPVCNLFLSWSERLQAALRRGSPAVSPRAGRLSPTAPRGPRQATATPFWGYVRDGGLATSSARPRAARVRNRPPAVPQHRGPRGPRGRQPSGRPAARDALLPPALRGDKNRPSHPASSPPAAASAHRPQRKRPPHSQLREALLLLPSPPSERTGAAGPGPSRAALPPLGRAPAPGPPLPGAAAGAS